MCSSRYGFIQTVPGHWCGPTNVLINKSETRSNIRSQQQMSGKWGWDLWIPITYRSLLFLRYDGIICSTGLKVSFYQKCWDEEFMKTECFSSVCANNLISNDKHFLPTWYFKDFYVLKMKENITYVLLSRFNLKDNCEFEILFQLEQPSDLDTCTQLIKSTIEDATYFL